MRQWAPSRVNGTRGPLFVSCTLRSMLSRRFFIKIGNRS